MASLKSKNQYRIITIRFQLPITSVDRFDPALICGDDQRMPAATAISGRAIWGPDTKLAI
jgi:hypothetical protein